MKRKGKNKGIKRRILIAAVSLSLLFMAGGTALFLFVFSDIIKEEFHVPFQEVTIAEDEFAGKYYYQKLSGPDQEAYREIAQGLMEQSEVIYAHCKDAADANEILEDVLKDFPEIFWCDSQVTSTSYEMRWGGGGYTELRPEYNCTVSEKEKRKAEIDQAVNACLAQVNPEASDYEKILYVYEYIVNTVDYDLAASDNQNIYSVFALKRSVCAGYSKAAQYLLERLGVFCTYVTGTAKGQEHAWNLVQCEGEYCYLDVTWGDPVYQQEEGESMPEDAGVAYDYMCCDDAEIFRTHTLDESVSMPECATMAYNYYVVNGMYYESYDPQMIMDAMNARAGAGANPTVVKFASPELYLQAIGDIMGSIVPEVAQNVCEWYGLYEVQYYYQDDAELGKLTIYWNYG